MTFCLSFTPTAKDHLRDLKYSPHLEKRYKAVTKALRFLQENPRHPSLQTHEYYSIKGPQGEKIFEAYAEGDTPAAYRIFFYYGFGNRKPTHGPLAYGQGHGEIVIVAITPHS